jgi:Na+-translocating ferredoxin:NAD+ oxidoreductase RnfD subunit
VTFIKAHPVWTLVIALVLAWVVATFLFGGFGPNIS